MVVGEEKLEKNLRTPSGIPISAPEPLESLIITLARVLNITIRNAIFKKDSIDINLLRR